MILLSVSQLISGVLGLRMHTTASGLFGGFQGSNSDPLAYTSAFSCWTVSLALHGFLKHPPTADGHMDCFPTLTL